MTNLNVRTSFLSLSAIVLLFAGCLRDTPPVPDNYQAYPLSITADELPNGSFRVRWNAIKSADFIEYQVIRNVGDSVPYIPNNQVALSNININLEVIKRISDADSTFFIDEVTIPTAKTYLRVFAVLKDRNLSSRNVEIPVKTNIKEVLFAANDMLFVPEDKRLALFSRAAVQLGVYHTDLNTLATSTAFNFSLGQNAEMAYGNFNNVSEVYIPNFSQLTVKNFSTPTLFSAFFGSSNMESVLFDKANNVLLTVGSQPTIIRTYSRFNTGISNISFASFATSVTQVGYALRTANLNREAIAVSSVTNNNSNVIWFTYNTSGQQITPLKTLTTTLPITKRPFAVAPDNQFFITGNKGLIFNRDMAISDSLRTRTAETRYIDMIFSDDKTRLLALRNGANNTKEKLIDVYKYPSFEFERSIAFRSNPTRLFQDGTSLLLVGVSPNNARNTMVERVAF